MAETIPSAANPSSPSPDFSTHPQSTREPPSAFHHRSSAQRVSTGERKREKENKEKEHEDEHNRYTAPKLSFLSMEGALLSSFKDDRPLSFHHHKDGEERGRRDDDGQTPTTASCFEAVKSPFEEREKEEKKLDGEESFLEKKKRPGLLAWFMHPKREYTARERNIILIILSVSVATGIIGGTMYTPALHHIQVELNATASEINLTLSIYIGMSALGPIFFGFIADIWGRKILLFFSQVLGTIACFLLYSSSTLPSLTFYRALQGIYGTLVGVAAAGIVADIFPERERGTAMGWVTLGIAVGPVLGPVVGGVIAGSLRWQYIFLINGVLAAINTVLGLFYIQESLIERVKLNLSAILSPLVMCLKPVFLIYSLPSSFVFGIYFYIVSILSAVFAVKFGYGVIESGLLFSPMGMGMIIASILGGRVIDKMGAENVLLFSLSAPVLVFIFALVLDGSLAGILVVTFVLGGVVILSANSLTVLLTIQFSENKGSAVSAYRFAGYGLSFICVQLGGTLQDNGVSEKMTCIYYGIGAAVCSIPLVVIMVMRKLKKGREQREKEEDISLSVSTASGLEEGVVGGKKEEVEEKTPVGDFLLAAEVSTPSPRKQTEEDSRRSEAAV